MILLCGYGGDSRRFDEVEVKKQIVNLCKNKSVAIITNAKPKENVETCVQVSKFLTSYKIKNKLFDLDEQDFSWQTFDVIYFGGGSPLKLMRAIERNNVKNYDWNGKDIIGQSAGGMILFKHFCDDIFEETKQANAEDYRIFEGLGIVDDDRAFTPHSNNLDNDYGRNYLECLKKNKIKSIFISDGEFLIIDKGTK